ncbi:MAG: helix-turn-helix domain-containing protein [Pseudolabrys sp.]|nr:helix-turn-helix domain-containing protein [Pseudolabrys sp.]
MDDESPLTLEDAAARFFRGGKVTADTLRGYVRKGKLRSYRVGKHYWTTASDIRNMLSVCRVAPNGVPLTEPSGSEAQTSAALEAMRETARALKERARKK